MDFKIWPMYYGPKKIRKFYKKIASIGFKLIKISFIEEHYFTEKDEWALKRQLKVFNINENFFMKEKQKLFVE